LDYALYTSFLSQEYIIFDYFTVREALKFVGTLNLNLFKQKLNKRVEKILNLLNPTEIADRNIGSFVKKGLSEVEIKRA
jgi:ABC-type Na+ transport system ATPase subunit NatA